jgi:protein-S-isoprenylcysteine O-methyltransferase Ste14
VRSFVDRGGVWVAVQFVWFAAVVLVGRLDLATFAFSGRQTLGWVLIGGALVLGIAASSSLGRNLTPFPKPVADGSMVEHGPYRLVRHPIYTAVIIGMLGIAVRGGDGVSVALAAGLIPFFYAKSTFEERHLAARFPGYGAYQNRVRRRLIPGLL